MESTFDIQVNCVSGANVTLVNNIKTTPVWINNTCSRHGMGKPVAVQENETINIIKPMDKRSSEIDDNVRPSYQMFPSTRQV